MSLVPRRSSTTVYVDSNRAIEVYPERANLYALDLSPMPKELYLQRSEIDGEAVETIHFQHTPGSQIVEASVRNIRRALTTAILAVLPSGEFRTGDRDEIIVDTSENFTPGPTSLQIYRSFLLRVMHFKNRYYLCINHRLKVRSVFSLARLADHGYELPLHSSQRALFKEDDEWWDGHLASIEGEYCHIKLKGGIEKVLPLKSVIPRLTRSQVSGLAPAIDVNPRLLEQMVKDLSFLTSENAPLERLAACNNFAERIAESAFPILDGRIVLDIDPRPAVLKSPEFSLGGKLEEAQVVFNRTDQTKRAKDILKGLTGLGAYEKPAAQLRLMVMCTENRAPMMQNLLRQLNKGSKLYKGAKWTFGSDFAVIETITCPSIDDYGEAIRHFIRTPNRGKTNVALVYLPKGESDVSDPNHPYFKVKGQLVREGLASQMIDESTLRNPNYRDLNIALKIFAKAGYAPWVLDEALDEADLFIGLSSSQTYHEGRVSRVMGYVNVFDAYGRWRFYEGNADSFRFEDRLKHFGDLVRNSLAAYKVENGGKLRLIHIHLTKPFSREERSILADAVHEVEPEATVVFVWINPGHGLRMYDLSEGVGGCIRRARSLIDDPGEDEPMRLYLTTTGENIFDQKGMGTPIPLELTIWTDPDKAPVSPDSIAQQILSLTRLNWASSRNFCHEPITTKFAGDIARKMNAFMQDSSFTVDSRLRKVPWFL
jgi:hypothetical protein